MATGELFVFMGDLGLIQSRVQVPVVANEEIIHPAVESNRRQRRTVADQGFQGGRVFHG